MSQRWMAAMAVVGLGSCGGEPPVPAAPPPIAPPVQAPAEPVEEPPSQAELGELNDERRRLIAAGDLDGADKLCAGLLQRDNPIARAEGHKCSANVLVGRAVDNGGGVMISDAAQRLTVGGVASPPRFAGESMPKAIAQLDQAALLTPADVSIHQGRLFLAFTSGDYKRAASSLELSLKQHPEAPSTTWLEYVDNFPTAQATPAIAYLRMLAAKYPNEGPVLTELGAWLTAANQTGEAKPILLKALALDDTNVLAQWRMGENLEAANDRKGAIAHYEKSLALGGPLLEERQIAYEIFKKVGRP
jgi:tetratricopeptide (TPR) repeat protein